MDLRKKALGILVSGSPAPGVNSVISTAAIEAINSHCTVFGFFSGWKHIKNGLTTETRQIFLKDVITIFSKGGSVLRTSKEQLNSDIEIDNALRVFQHYRIRYLITIGGADSAQSAHLLSKAAKQANFPLSIVHVPKSIFSDLPLPQDAKTFGFSTAREIGAQIIENLHEDARALDRWYIVSVIGSKAGHLSLGIGKSAAATMTLIPEEFDLEVKLDDIIDHVDACMIKRETMNKKYGVILLTEGLVDKMHESDIKEYFGTIDDGHELLARTVVQLIKSRIKHRKKPVPRIISRDIGFELRAANPNSADRDLARNLGYGATHHLLDNEETDCIVTMKGQNLVAIPFDEILDSETGITQIKKVDINSLSFEVATKYMLRLRKSDIENPEMVYKMAKVCKMDTIEFIERFKHVTAKF